MNISTGHRIDARVFLVGCGRSGTTLLQSLLAAHPHVASFPESHFFDSLMPSRRKWLGRLGLASRNAKPKLSQFLEIINHIQLRERLPRLMLTVRQSVKAFVGILDTLALEEGKRIWLEKSPSHVRNLEYIEKFVDGAKFIHIIRSGADVVASLYEVSRKYPDAWFGPWSIDRCIDTWIEDVGKSLQHLHKPDHRMVRYERLVEDTEDSLRGLCEFIGVDFREEMLRDYRAAAKKIVMEREPWKANVSGPIRSANATKFYELFDEKQRLYILERVSAIKLD